MTASVHTLHKVSQHALQAGFAQIVVIAVLRNASLWAAVHGELDDGLFNNDAAQRIMFAARSMDGTTPTVLTVLQKLHHWAAKGTHKIHAGLVAAAHEYLDAAADAFDAAPMTAEQIIAAMRDVVERRWVFDRAMLASAAVANPDAEEKLTRLDERRRQFGTKSTATFSRVPTTALAIAQELKRSADARRVSTGIPGLDDAFDGGVQEGQLFMGCALTGGGKSQMLSGIAAAALKQGLNIAYATLEISAVETCLRIEAAGTNRKISDVRDAMVTRVELHNAGQPTDPDWFETVTGRLVIERMSEGTPVSDVVAWADSVSPDVLIVDYADLLARPDGRATDRRGSTHVSKSEYAAMREVYLALRAWAQDPSHGKLRWAMTASAAKNVDKRKVKILDVDSCADSAHKSRACDVMVTINPIDDAMTQVNLFVAKNRAGRSRQLVGPIETAFDRGQLAARFEETW